MGLLDLITPRLVSPKQQADGSLVAQCPACARVGADLKGHNHLRVYPSGAFGCCVCPGDHDHNRLIRSLIRGDGDAALGSDVEYLDPDPRPDVDKVYPETTLSKLLPIYDYWTGRGVSEDAVRRLGGGLAPADQPGKLSGRFVFPIRDDTNRIVGWSGRLVGESSFAPNWKHLFKVSRACWPWDVNRDEIKRTRVVILLESIGDALTLSTHGIHNWLVLFGLNLNARIVGRLISVSPRRIVISTNNDAIGEAKSKEAGNKAADKVRSKLLGFFNEETVRIRLPQTGKDWNVATAEEIEVFKQEVLS